MNTADMSEQEIASMAAAALERLVSELRRDEADLSADRQAGISEQLAQGRRAVAAAISAAQNAKAALEK